MSSVCMGEECVDMRGCGVSGCVCESSVCMMRGECVCVGEECVDICECGVSVCVCVGSVWGVCVGEECVCVWGVCVWVRSVWICVGVELVGGVGVESVCG